MPPRQFLFRFGALCLTLPLLAQEEANQPVQISSTERVDFHSGGIVRVNGSYGDLYVEGWDRPEVEVKTAKSTRHFYDSDQQEQAIQRLERVRIVAERRSPTEFAISTILPVRGGFFTPGWSPVFPFPRKAKGGVTVAYEIRVPRDSQLVIQHGGGFVLVANMIADVKVSNRSGDIILMVPDDCQCSIDARTRFGPVTSDFAGAAHRNHLVGERFHRAGSSAAHRIHLRAGFGGITIKHVPPESEPPGRGGVK